MYLILAYLLHSSLAQLQPPDEPISQPMKAYVMRTKVTLSTIYDTVGIVGVDEHYSSAIYDFLIKYKNTDAVLIGSRHKNYTAIVGHLQERTRNLFCLVNTVDNFEDMLRYVAVHPFFRLDGYIQFIVGKKVDDKDWLEDRLKLIWHNDILNYVIVYQYQSTVEVMGYDPFNDTIYNYTNHPIGFKIYPPKMDNMYGSPLKVGMMVDSPRHTLIDGVIVGEDANLIRTIAQEINATLHLSIYKNAEELSVDVKKRRLHLSATRFFTYTKSPYIVQKSYPLQMDYMTILVPTAGEMARYKYIFLTFHFIMWICLIVLTTIMVFLYMYFARITGLRYNTYQEATMAILTILINNSYAHFNKGRESIRILSMSWALFSLLIVTAFSTTLRSSLINTEYNSEITNLEDLQESGLKIGFNYAAFHSVAQQFEAIEKQLVHINNTDVMVKRAMQGDKSAGFILLSTYSKLLVTRKDAKNRNVYKILDNYFVAGHNVYNFAENSPYLEKIDSLLLLLRQFRLSRHGIGNLATNTLVSNTDVKLSLDHLQTAYIILFYGFVLSTLAFVGEKIAHAREMKKRSAQKITFDKNMRKVVEKLVLKEDMPIKLYVKDD